MNADGALTIGAGLGLGRLGRFLTTGALVGAGLLLGTGSAFAGAGLASTGGLLTATGFDSGAVAAATGALGLGATASGFGVVEGGVGLTVLAGGGVAVFATTVELETTSPSPALLKNQKTNPRRSNAATPITA